MNNPLKYTDPDGEFWHLIIGAAIGGTINWLTHGAKLNGEGLKYFGIGAAAGALSAGVGMGITASLSGASFGAGFLGTQSAMTAISTSFTTSFITGAAVGGGAGFAGGFTTGFGNGLMQGQNFGEAMWSGTKGGLIGGASSALLGGMLGGLDATGDNRTFWNGDRKSNEFGRPIPRAGNVREEVEEFVHQVNDGLKNEIEGWKVEIDLESVDIYDITTTNRWKYVQYDAKVNYSTNWTNLVSNKTVIEPTNQIFNHITNHNY